MVSRNAKPAQFREAAEPTLEEIRRDRGRVSERAVPLVAFIEEHLFDADLDLRLGKRIGALPEETVRDFYEGLGLAPSTYARERRLDVAERLLRGTRWKVWRVADETGFRSAKQLAVWFKRRTGKSPSDVRPAPSAAAAEEPRESDREHSVQLEVRALAGALAPQARVALIQRLRSLYPAVPRREPSRPLFGLSMPGYPHERKLAAAVWKAARDLPGERLRRALCQRLRFRSPALFRLLGERGREIGRHDRKRGVVVTETGVEVLEANADAFGESVHDLMTVGWSWTANQRRLLLDWPGAEEAFGFACQEWETPRASRDPLAEAEYCNLLASFRLFQRLFDEAAHLADRALLLLRMLDDRDLLIRVLILRADIDLTAGRSEESIPYLREALEHVDEKDDPYLALSLSSQLAVAYFNVGELESALEAVSQSKVLNTTLALDIVQSQLLWLEGLISKERGRGDCAEQQLEGSRSGFIELGEMGHFAFVTLALVELLVEQDRVPRALMMISEIIPVLETFKIHREILAAVRLLRAAVEDAEISLELLRRIKDCLKPIRGKLLAHSPTG